MTAPVIPWTECFTSVTDVWIVWLAAMAVGAWLIRHSLRTASWSNARAFAADERGASYALSYVMTFPVYLMLMCLILQATLILMVKMGTVYASYAAARTAIVWRPSQPERPERNDDRLRLTASRTERAAAVAMAPFASGFQRHLDQSISLTKHNPFTQLEAMAYATAYSQIASHNRSADSGKRLYALNRFDPHALADAQYVKNKLMYARVATSVDLHTKDIPAWNSDFKVTVTHRMPMHVPAVGRVFANRKWPFFARDVSTTAVLPSEAPETVSRRLNIPYDPEGL